MNAPVHHPAAVRTTCPYCGVGCGILAAPDSRGGAAITGDPAHPANFGRLCSKGSALSETLGLEGRLLHPMLRENGTLVRKDWDAALDRVAEGFRRVIERHGPDAVAFYLSGQMSTEDYYVANKLMKGFIGSANVDTNSRLCMASSVAGHRRAFGSDTVPGNYEDIDQADLIVLVGSNAAWCHPVLFQRMVQNRRERGSSIVVIDPRRTATAEEADLFLPIMPGADTALFSGLLVYLADNHSLDYAFIESHTQNLEETLARARQIAPNLTRTSEATGLSQADIARFFELFGKTARTVTCYSQGVNQSTQGTDKVNAIINCHLAAGRIGKPGTGPFSLTGQPNAMGGREVGGLANQLAAHMGFSAEEIDRVGRFWKSPRMARREGRKAVDMFDAIGRGEIKALWVMATNPVVSLPRAGAVRAALGKLELLVVSENMRSTDTINAGAHVLLPAAAWGERDSLVTNSERRLSRQRQFLPLPGEARPDWWIVSEVGKRLGYASEFSFDSPAAVIREHAALSTFENDGRRDFDIGALATMSDDEFDALDPVQWPLPRGSKSGWSRLFAEGSFFTPDRKARFVAPDAPALRSGLTSDFPFRLNTGRVRDQWHTMARSGRSPRLAAHLPEPYVEMNPGDAAAAALGDGDLARVSTPYGSGVFKVRESQGQQRGSLFVPIHWSDETASSARVGELVAPHTDPPFRQPELKATPASIIKAEFSLRGFALSRRPLAMPAGTWWARVAVEGGWGYLLAANGAPSRWSERARELFGWDRAFAAYSDAPRNIYRVAAFAGEAFEGCLFVGPASSSSHWDAVKAIFANGTLARRDRRSLLSGKPANGMADTGPLICACFGVGLNTICEAIASGAAASVDDIGKALRAGTNCGSCLPELKKVVAQRTSHERIASPV